MSTNDGGHWPVVIIGGGPAASAMAIGLGHVGIGSLIIERDDDTGDKIGETLPPNARPLLASLGVDLDAGVHLRSYGTSSAWGSAAVATRDYINNPYGHGWHLDRRHFEHQLIERAAEVGATRWNWCGVPEVVWRDPSWSITLADGRTAFAEFVVDATGRAARLARSLGSHRTRGDAAVGVVAFLKAQSIADADQRTLSFVESVPNGWWYSAPIPHGRLATAFVTSPSLLDRSMRSPDVWVGAVAAAPHTHDRIRSHGYELDGEILVSDASGGIMAPLHGRGWVAIGDAATSYDPLSSHGITAALVTGKGAAEAVASGDPGAFVEYASKIERGFATYREMRLAYYGAEQRWSTEPFWSAIVNPADNWLSD